MFFMAEYVNMVVVSALTVTLFFGGWSLPGYEPHGWGGAILSALVFFAKTAFFVWIFIWVRWTLPRFRYDQLMRLGWLVFFEIALANIILTAALLMWFRI